MSNTKIVKLEKPITVDTMKSILSGLEVNLFKYIDIEKSQKSAGALRAILAKASNEMNCTVRTFTMDQGGREYIAFAKVEVKDFAFC